MCLSLYTLLILKFHCACGCLMWCDNVQFCVKVHLAFLRHLTLRVVVLCGVTTCNLLWRYIWPFLRYFTVRVDVMCGVTLCNLLWRYIWLSDDISLCGWLYYVVCHRAIWCEGTFGLLTTFHSAVGCLMWCDTLQIFVQLHLAFLRYFTVREVVLCGVTRCKLVRSYIWPS
jgi:hypothetical protein